VHIMCRLAPGRTEAMDRHATVLGCAYINLLYPRTSLTHMLLHTFLCLPWLLTPEFGVAVLYVV
jgi:hypothetical protein